MRTRAPRLPALAAGCCPMVPARLAALATFLTLQAPTSGLQHFPDADLIKRATVPLEASEVT